jgi:hypothetical protein
MGRGGGGVRGSLQKTIRTEPNMMFVLPIKILFACVASVMRPQLVNTIGPSA